MIYNTGHSNESISHLFKKLMEEEQQTPSPEPRECWQDRSASHYTVTKSDDKKNLSRLYYNYPREVYPL